MDTIKNVSTFVPNRELIWFLSCSAPIFVLYAPTWKGEDWTLGRFELQFQKESASINMETFIPLSFVFTRLAFSCIWEMNHKAEILKTHFTKSVINSKVKCPHGFPENTFLIQILVFSYSNSLLLCFRRLWLTPRLRWGSTTPARRMTSPRVCGVWTNWLKSSKGRGLRKGEELDPNEKKYLKTDFLKKVLA